MNKKTIWHPVSEKPEKQGWIIEGKIDKISRKIFVIQAFKYSLETDWEGHVKQDGVEEWAYQEEWFEETQS